MNEIIVKDKDFILEFHDFNLESKKIIAEELLKSSKQNQNNKELIKSITLQLIAIYVEITETALMILYALKDYKTSDKSFIYHFRKIEIKELQNADYNSEKLLKEIKKMTLEEFISNFNLQHLNKEYDNLSAESKIKIHELFGEFDQIKTQFYSEMNNLKTSLESIVSNRKTENEDVPFYKLYNKLKHGMQLYNTQNEEYVNIIINASSINKTSSKLEVYSFNCKNSTNEFLKNQIDVMVFACKHILSAYFLSITL